MKYYYYEEVGWFVIFLLNTIASIILLLTIGLMKNHELLLQINLLFGFLYLPWQFFHLRSLRLRSNNQEVITKKYSPMSKLQIMKGFHKSIKLKIPSTKNNNGVILYLLYNFE